MSLLDLERPRVAVFIDPLKDQMLEALTALGYTVHDNLLFPPDADPASADYRAGWNAGVDLMTKSMVRSALDNAVAKAPVKARLFDLPLGTRFRYSNGLGAYVLLDRGGSGLVAHHMPFAPGQRTATQGIYSAADSRAEFEAMEVEVVQ